MDEQPAGIDIPTAALALGISPTAVRRRIQRGTLTAYKAADATWRVVLDEPPAGRLASADRDIPVHAVRDRPVHPKRYTSDNTPAAPPSNEAAVLRVRLDEMEKRAAAAEADIAFLRGELTARTAEVERAHILLQSAHRQIAATAPEALQAAQPPVDRHAPHSEGEASPAPTQAHPQASPLASPTPSTKRGVRGVVAGQIRRLLRAIER